MVDQVIDRTGANYQDAKEALIKCDGDVLEAIVLLDSREKADEEHVIIKKIKELIEKGKISRILIEKDEVNILNIPVLAGIIGGIVFINATIVGLITAIVLGYDIYVIDDKHIEARKAFALGEEIEFNQCETWITTGNPTWKADEYRPKPKEPIYDYHFTFRRGDKWHISIGRWQGVKEAMHFITGEDITRFEPSKRLKK